jgi:hypothetical protein
MSLSPTLPPRAYQTLRKIEQEVRALSDKQENAATEQRPSTELLASRLENVADRIAMVCAFYGPTDPARNEPSVTCQAAESARGEEASVGSPVARYIEYSLALEAAQAQDDEEAEGEITDKLMDIWAQLSEKDQASVEAFVRARNP